MNKQMESETFDIQMSERMKNGFIPDLRNLQKVDWFYNNIWRDPEFVKIVLMPRIQFVLDIVKQRCGKVAELGCGCGYLSLELAREGMDVLGIDISPKSIEIANETAAASRLTNGFGSLQYRCKDITKINLEKSSFDSIVFFLSMHHLSDIEAIVAKCNDALKIGGNLVVVEPIQDQFTRKDAEFAAIFRMLLPTWISYNEKIEKFKIDKDWHKYVDDIYDEYLYKGEHSQSSNDNVSSSGEKILEHIGRWFDIKTVEYESAFMDKLIGGLRGDDKYIIAKFLKFLDDNLVKRKILSPNIIRIHAVKE